MTRSRAGLVLTAAVCCSLATSAVVVESPALGAPGSHAGDQIRYDGDVEGGGEIHLTVKDPDTPQREVTTVALVDVSIVCTYMGHSFQEDLRASGSIAAHIAGGGHFDGTFTDEDSHWTIEGTVPIKDHEVARSAPVKGRLKLTSLDQSGATCKSPYWKYSAFGPRGH